MTNKSIGNGKDIIRHFTDETHMISEHMERF